MKKIIVWDLPIRIFHWSFAVTMLLALILALVVDEKDPIFRYHMLFGLSAGALLILRLVIAIIGALFTDLGTFIQTDGNISIPLRFDQGNIKAIDWT